MMAKHSILILSILLFSCKSLSDSKADTNNLKDRVYLEKKYQLYPFPPKQQPSFPFERFGWLTEPSRESYLTNYTGVAVDLDKENNISLVGHTSFTEPCRSLKGDEFVSCQNSSNYYYAKAGNSYIFYPSEPVQEYIEKRLAEEKYDRERLVIGKKYAKIYDSQQSYDPLPEGCFMDFQQQEIDQKQGFFKLEEKIFITKSQKFLKWYAAQVKLEEKYGFDPEKNIIIVVCGKFRENRQYTLRNHLVAELPTYSVEKIIIKVDGDLIVEF
ncbi:MAG: hypothetical protein LDLANPLL_01822 [Turneriella sp.]|nr:hypothetical protein [Turneriella sp.]